MRIISLKRIFRIGILAVALVVVAAAAPGAQQAQPASKTNRNSTGQPAAKPATTKSVHAEPKPDTVPVTTSSKEARHDYELGMLHREDLLFDEEGLNDFRRAVKADPNFALCHATIAFFSDDPREEKREILLAKQTLAHAVPDEKLLIRFMIGTKDGELIPAISAMNDLRASYPKDSRLGNMYAEWLLAVQLNYDRAAEVLQSVLKADPNYYPALNNLAYCYSLSGDYSKTASLMQQYVSQLPGQPNPQDSYGELLRMAGDFKDSIEHYRQALFIAPAFTTSQLGIASNYAFMGDQERARVEYLHAISMTKERTTKLQYRMLWAMTYFRAGQQEQARKAYSELALLAHKEDLAVDEAECYRTMALFNSSPEGALKDLDKAQGVLSQKHELPRADRESELAIILQTRAFIAARAGMGDVAEKALALLAPIAAKSRSNVIQAAYHSTNGAVLLAQGKYAEAVPEFQENPRDPLSLQLLADAQSKAGQTADSAKTLATLAAINDERVETAAVAQPVRDAIKRNNPASTQANTPE
jgi:tetratricopeptide (TPR) repeat protein